MSSDHPEEAALASTAPDGDGQAGEQPALWKRILQGLVGGGIAIGMIGWGLPYFAKTTWSEIWATATSLPMSHAIGMQLLMLLGLYCYTFTFTGSLSGLSHVKALIVNLCGSSVSNLLPGGGAAGLAATFTILRSWGFSKRAISTSAIVTGVWNVMARLLLPVIAIITLFISGVDLPTALQDAAIGGAVSGVLILVGFIAFFVSEPAAAWIGRALDRIIRFVRRGRGSARLGSKLILDQRDRTIDVVRNGWLGLTFGMVGFFGCYFLLFYALAQEFDLSLHVGLLFAAFAISRLLTSVAITPGGLGVSETATAAAMIGWGADPTGATAVVVLFSIFTHVMEVPLGIAGWFAWSLSTKSPDAESAGEIGSATAAPPTTGRLRPRS